MPRPKKPVIEPKEVRVLKVTAAANGRTAALIECPFCDTQCGVPVWSLAGTGKRCSKCGAVLQGMYSRQVMAYPHGKKRVVW